MSSSSKKRAYRGWITAEEIAAEGADLGNDDAMALDEDGRPYVKHTSKARYKEAQDAVRAVFFRQTAKKNSKLGIGRVAFEDVMDDEDALWKDQSRGGKTLRKKRAVNDMFQADKTEAKINRRVKSGRNAIDNAGQGKTGRELLIERVKGKEEGVGGKQKSKEGSHETSLSSAECGSGKRSLQVGPGKQSHAPNQRANPSRCCRTAVRLWTAWNWQNSDCSSRGVKGFAASRGKKLATI